MNLQLCEAAKRPQKKSLSLSLFTQARKPQYIQTLSWIMINIGLKCVALKKAFRVKTPASEKVNNLNPQ